MIALWWMMQRAAYPSSEPPLSSASFQAEKNILPHAIATHNAALHRVSPRKLVATHSAAAGALTRHAGTLLIILQARLAILRNQIPAHLTPHIIFRWRRFFSRHALLQILSYFLTRLNRYRGHGCNTHPCEENNARICAGTWYVSATAHHTFLRTGIQHQKRGRSRIGAQPPHIRLATAWLGDVLAVL
ncbi:hypothetical protein [Pseudoduganella violacea]|uniref:Uncharacterized protein n=1 Tax=Pseudoduganella violacea TaxID=1715466 RepID=A0A7W5FW66_9BURK|nr:hypothetical protein [Pseudoduganella violacea]MBB3121715.1 hypothetical protein [Pseudoduganella violacea]